MFIKKMLGASCNLCLTIRCSFKIFFMLGAHGNLYLAIRWSLKIFLYGGCQWQPMLGHQVVIENTLVYWVPMATYAWPSFCQVLFQTLTTDFAKSPGRQATDRRLKKYTTKGNNWVQCKPAGLLQASTVPCLVLSTSSGSCLLPVIVCPLPTDSHQDRKIPLFIRQWVFDTQQVLQKYHFLGLRNLTPTKTLGVANASLSVASNASQMMVKRVKNQV